MTRKNATSVAVVVTIVVVAIFVVTMTNILRRRGVDIIREGSGTGSVTGHLDNPCPELPANVKSANEAEIKAALTRAATAAKESQGGNEIKATFEGKVRSELERVLASSDLANDLAVIDSSVCNLCLSLALSTSDCAKARTDSQQTYLELKKKK